MLNNHIIITDDTSRACGRRNEQCIVDAAKLTESEWAELCARNVNSNRVQLVQCAKCWTQYSEVQWLQTFNRLGGRVILTSPESLAQTTSTKTSRRRNTGRTTTGRS